MAKVLLPKNKFYGKASYLKRNNATTEDYYSLMDEVDISREEVTEWIKRQAIAQSVSNAVMASREQLAISYNQLDEKFIRQYDNIVVFRRGENISFYQYSHGVYLPVFDKDMENHVDGFMAQECLFEYRTSRRKVTDTVARIASLLSRTPKRHFSDEEISDKFYLNLSNGLLDMESFTLLPHTPDYFSTVQVPFPFDPTATTELFDEYLKIVSNQSESTAQMIQEMFGYCISDGNPKHKVFYLYGDTARNGKSCTAKLLCGLLGWGNVSTLSLSQIASESSSILTALVGKQLNFSDEISSKFVESSALTKMSSEGQVEVNPKFKSAYLYTVKAKFIIACNDLPRFKDSQGMKHRMISIPFRYQIPEGNRIDNYDQILLKKEGSGILNWAIAGVKLIKANRVFSANEESLEDAHDIAMQSNTVYHFLEEMYDFDEKYEEKFTALELYGQVEDHTTPPTRYRLFCKQNGILPQSSTSFSRELKRFMRETGKVTDARNSIARYYSGLKLKEYVPEEKYEFKDTVYEDDEMTQSALAHMDK